MPTFPPNWCEYEKSKLLNVSGFAGWIGTPSKLFWLSQYSCSPKLVHGLLNVTPQMFPTPGLGGMKPNVLL